MVVFILEIKVVLIFYTFLLFFPTCHFCFLCNCYLQCFSFWCVSIPYLSMWDYCNIIMVHKLVNIIQSLKRESLCNMYFYGLGQTQGPLRSGQPTLKLRHYLLVMKLRCLLVFSVPHVTSWKNDMNFKGSKKFENVFNVSTILFLH